MEIRLISRAYMAGNPRWISVVRPYQNIGLLNPGEKCDVVVFENCYPDPRFWLAPHRASSPPITIFDICSVPTNEDVDALETATALVAPNDEMAAVLRGMSGKPVAVLPHRSVLEVESVVNVEGEHHAFLNFWPYKSEIIVLPDAGTLHEVSDTISEDTVKTLLPSESSMEALATLLKNSKTVSGDASLVRQLTGSPCEIDAESVIRSLVGAHDKWLS